MGCSDLGGRVGGLGGVNVNVLIVEVLRGMCSGGVGGFGGWW